MNEIEEYESWSSTDDEAFGAWLAQEHADIERQSHAHRVPKGCWSPEESALDNDALSIRFGNIGAKSRQEKKDEETLCAQLGRLGRRTDVLGRTELASQLRRLAGVYGFRATDAELFDAMGFASSPPALFRPPTADSDEVVWKVEESLKRIFVPSAGVTGNLTLTAARAVLRPGGKSDAGRKALKAAIYSLVGRMVREDVALVVPEDADEDIGVMHNVTAGAVAGALGISRVTLWRQVGGVTA